MSSDRWSRLRSFVASWYARPLEESDGEPQEAITQHEAKLGHRLPPALAEWYSLIGRRMACVQEVFVPLWACGTEDALEVLGPVDDEGFAVYAENQACWRALVALGDALDESLDDPPVEVDDEDEPWFGDSLSDFLFGALVSETCEAIRQGYDQGPLGELSGELAGGWWEAEAGKELAATLPPLLGPAFAGSPFDLVAGDDELLVGGGGDWWIARTPQARERAASVAAPPEQAWSLAVLVFGHDEEEYFRLCGLCDSYITPSRDGGPTCVELRPAPQDPAERFETLRATLEAGGLGHLRLEAGSRGERSYRYAPLWPANLEAFARPFLGWQMFTRDRTG